MLVGVYPDIDEDQTIFVFFRERLFHGGVKLHRLTDPDTNVPKGFYQGLKIGQRITVGALRMTPPVLEGRSKAWRSLQCYLSLAGDLNWCFNFNDV